MANANPVKTETMLTNPKLLPMTYPVTYKMFTIHNNEMMKKAIIFINET